MAQVAAILAARNLKGLAMNSGSLAAVLIAVLVAVGASMLAIYMHRSRRRREAERKQRYVDQAQF